MPRIALGVLANILGLLFVVWPVLPKEWGVWDFVGRVFHASNDPSMGIQFMFFWLMTVPMGAGLSFLGTKLATRSSQVAALVSFALTVGGVYSMFWIAECR